MKKCFLTAIVCLSGFVLKAQQDNTLSANDYIFFPGNEFSLPPNGVATLSVKHIVNNVPEDVILNSEQWTIDGKEISSQNTGEGNLKLATLQLDKTIYTAPAKVPPHNPVVITLSFQPEEQKTKIILYCRIHIIDKENYFWLSSGNNVQPNGELYELKEPLAASMRMESAYYVNNQWNIGAHGLRKVNSNENALQQMAITASLAGNGTGVYKWNIKWNDKQGLVTPLNTITVTGMAADGNPFQYFSGDCIPHGDDNCHHIALEGSTTITVFDKQKKIIKGYFSGQLVSMQGRYMWASGAFSVKMK